MKRKHLVDPDGLPTGNSWNRAETTEDGFMAALYEQEDGCPECGSDKPLRSTRKGWKCPDCREIVIPSE